MVSIGTCLHVTDIENIFVNFPVTNSEDASKLLCYCVIVSTYCLAKISV